MGGYPLSVKTKVLDCGFVGLQFELQSYCYFHFPSNTLKKGMNPLITSSHELNPIFADK